MKISGGYFLRVTLIENTTTKAGLKVFACISNKVYETGRKVLDGFKE